LQQRNFLNPQSLFVTDLDSRGIFRDADAGEHFAWNVKTLLGKGEYFGWSSISSVTAIAPRAHNLT
jgi:hypothetical protein